MNGNEIVKDKIFFAELFNFNCVYSTAKVNTQFKQFRSLIMTLFF